jgi:hypothetical protein
VIWPAAKTRTIPGDDEGREPVLRLVAHAGDVDQPASADAGYAPCSGLSARLDRMVAGRSLAMFVVLLEVLADA